MPFKKQNLINPKTLFSNKIDFYSVISQFTDSYDNLVDFNFAEKFLYGRVTKSYLPMTIIDSSTNLKTLPNPSENNKQHKAVNFVVDQFIELDRQFEKCALIGNIRPNDKYLSKLKVYKAYSSSEILYINYYKQVIDSLTNIISSKKIYNSKTFLTYITPNIIRLAKDIPITKQQFIKSKKCPIHISGLAIDISNINPSNDLSKVQEFYLSPNFEFYLNTCRSYGFMLDREVPWRLIADLSSTEMINSARKYGYDSTDSIIRNLYSTNIVSNYNSFKAMIIEMFLKTVGTHSEKIVCNDGTVKEKILYADNSIINLTEDNMLDLYFRIRLAESEHHLTPDKHQAILTEAKARADKDLLEGLSIFELFICQPYDYSGSLTDLVRRSEESNAISDS